MIDNISNGRVAIAAASVWHVNDFVLAPNNFAARRQIMLDQLGIIQKLWRGETVCLPNGENRLVHVRIFPTPIQSELRVWLTTSSEDGCRLAGSRGFNLLTANFTHKFSELALGKCISIYRKHMQACWGQRGHVTLMLHTFLAESQEMLDKIAVPAMSRYLEANLERAKDGHREGWLESNFNFIGTPDTCQFDSTQVQWI
jgi:alkanesulfonate monooxygenase SsuD/methylene tetrahydromethanopterin reductase-like flavin-dependent oxidoreductase (luciferase family)